MSKIQQSDWWFRFLSNSNQRIHVKFPSLGNKENDTGQNRGDHENKLLYFSVYLFLWDKIRRKQFNDDQYVNLDRERRMYLIKWTLN